MSSTANGSAKARDEAAEDAARLRALADGDDAALHALYARHAPFVFALASRGLDRAAAEEIVQDVFFAVWRNAASFDPELGSVRTWLAAIAQRRVANELRRRSRRPRLEPDGEDRAAAAVDPAPDPVARAWLEFRRAAVREAVQWLPPEQRKALSLAFFEELSHQQVADVLQLRLGTAKTRIRSALGKLRERLSPIVALLAVAVLGAASFALHERAARSLDERALALVTSSEVTPLRLEGASGAESATHATYRARPGTPLAVLTLSRFPEPPAGRTYQAWVRHGLVYTSLGTARPDADGHARLVAEGSVLAVSPDAVEITVEPEGGSPAPTGPSMASWPRLGSPP